MRRIREAGSVGEWLVKKERAGFMPRRDETRANCRPLCRCNFCILDTSTKAPLGIDLDSRRNTFGEGRKC